VLRRFIYDVRGMEEVASRPAGFDPQQAGVLAADEAPPFGPQKWSKDL
jgi:hypothetical protein